MRKAVIDRFEDDYVVVEWLDTKRSEAVPSRFIPSGAKANDVLVRHNEGWIIDYQATKERAEKTEQLMNDLWKDA